MGCRSMGKKSPMLVSEARSGRRALGAIYNKPQSKPGSDRHGGGA